MRVIYKIKINEPQKVCRLPKGAEFLTAQCQDGDLCLWFMVDPNETETQDRRIEVVGTGMQFPNAPRKYLGTVQMPSGFTVWHIFELL